MIKKIIMLTILFTLISSGFLLAAETSSEEIRELISQGKTEKALDILQKTDLELDSDLKFYKALLLSWQGEYERAETILLDLIGTNPQRLDSYSQLARIYGWQRQFIKAEEIIDKAQNISYSSERTAILSQHAEWQGQYFKAKKLMEKAAANAETLELKSDYQKRLKRINRELKSSLYLEGRAVYSKTDKEDLELRFGLEKLVKDGVQLNTSAGANYFKEEFNFVFRSKIELEQPLISDKTFLSSEFVLYNGQSRDKYEMNNNFDYLINPQNLVGVNLNIIEDNINSNYQTFELEYEHRFKKTIMVLKNTSRHDDSGWRGDFSQHLDLYFPRDNYLLNLAVSHYDGEYIFKIGFEFSDLFSGDSFNLSNLNLWYNNDDVSNLDFRIDFK